MNECAIPSCTRIPDEGRALCAKCRKDFWPIIEREFAADSSDPAVEVLQKLFDAVTASDAFEIDRERPDTLVENPRISAALLGAKAVLGERRPYTPPAIETSWSPDPIGEPDWHVLDWPPKGEVDVTVRSGLVAIVVHLADGRTMILLDENDRRTLAAALLDVDRIRGAR